MIITQETIINAFSGASFLGSVDQWINAFLGQELIPIVDSRVMQCGGLFVALQGEHVDGHSYLGQAIEQGAIALLIDKKKQHVYEHLSSEEKEHILCIVVDDPLNALVFAATWWRTKLTMPVIGVTGSMGKTSTKELIGHIFRENNQTISLTHGNQNSLIGLSISVLKTKLTDQCAIFEMGINEVGEMEQLVAIARPTTAVLTGLAHAHTQGLVDFETLVIEKGKIFSQLKKEQVAIVHEKYLSLLQFSAAHRWLSVGTTNKADLWFEQKEVDDQSGERVVSGLMHYKSEEVLFTFKDLVPGRLDHMLLAVATVLLHGISLVAACQAASYFFSVKGRFEKTALPGGKGYVIDDACNANPETMIASISFFEELKTPLHKILVLGEMRELGTYEQEGHRLVLQKLAESKNIEKIILLGPLFKQLSLDLKFHSEIFSFDVRQKAFDFIFQLQNKYDSIILLKSSKSIGLSLLVPLFFEQKTQIES